MPYKELFTPPGLVEPERALQIATVAGALVGTTKALVGVWAAGQPDSDMEALTRAALDQLDPIWPDWLAQAPAAV